MCSFYKKFTQFSAAIGKTDPQKVVTSSHYLDSYDGLLDGQAGGHLKYMSPERTENILLKNIYM